MTVKRTDGGPAFSRPESASGWVSSDAQEGMSLRDYFAAKAMATFLATDSGLFEDIAAKAYQVADAMLRVR